MNKVYEEQFHNEIERILKKLYYEPLNPNGKDKRAIVETERKYVQYLIQHNLVRELNKGGQGFSLILERRGHEVFEGYKGWDDYRTKVIERQHRIENAKNMAQRFWWIPVLISILALGVSIIALIIKK